MPRKIPTFVALILLLIVVGGFIIGFEQFTATVSVASGSVAPQQILISNISDTSFTISWFTQKDVTAFVRVQSESSNLTFYDDRDSGDMPKKYNTHSVTVKNLHPGTSYTAEMFTNGKSSEEKRTVTTSSRLGNNSDSLDPAYGSIIDETNAPVVDALVYLTLDGSQTLSTVTRPTGSWLIPLSLIRSLDGSSYLETQERFTEELRVISAGGVTSATTDTLNDSPVPAMALGKTYDFRKLQAKAKAKTAVLGEQVAATATTWTISLNQPADGANLSTNVPAVVGNGVPGKIVVITLGIKNPTINSVMVGADGIWRFTPTKSLNPGKYIVTMTSTDTLSKPVAITHTFSIFKSGTQVLGDATPSASLTPTTTITPMDASPSPTLALPSETPTPTSTLAGQPIPTTGNFAPLSILLIVSIVFLITGAAFIL